MSLPALRNEFLRALAHYKRGELSEAESLCASIIKADPENFEVHHLLGVVLIARGDAHLAARELALAVAGMPTSHSAHRNYGVALARLGRLEEALASFGKSIALKPDDIESLISRGHACRALRHYEESLSMYDSVLRLRPNHALAWHRRALAWISTEADLPNTCVAKGFTRLMNYGRTIRPFGALIRALCSATSPRRMRKFHKTRGHEAKQRRAGMLSAHHFA